jgi:hypothetical protein
MGYQRFASLTHVQQQYNIMALVGNGFDIQVLGDYARSTSTRYQDFYYFLKMKGSYEENLILQQMEKLKNAGEPNWSDVEGSIAGLEGEGGNSEGLQEALSEIQREFSEFLNMVVDSDLLSSVSDDSQSRKRSHASLSTFLGDLADHEDLRKVPFGAKKGFYDLYNFFFVNFNYTSLLDNYLYLDSKQFDPHPHKTVATNFTFNTNPRQLGVDDGWNYESSGNLALQVVHPHGYQDIPRSLLFGTGYHGDPTNTKSRLSKPYWAQAELKYGHLFEDTHLFVIFGCSLGGTDLWWWSSIAKALSADPTRAVIVYWWTDASQSSDGEKNVLERFFDAAEVDEDDRGKLRRQICVVQYDNDSDRVFLSTKQ